MRHILVAVALVLFAGVSNAQTTVPFIFGPGAGSHPTGHKLNEDFAFVMKAIDANKALAQANDQAIVNYFAARVTKLEEQITMLEGQIAKLAGPITAADLVGIYTFSGLQTGLIPAALAGEVEAISYSGTVQLLATGQLLRNTRENGHDLLWTLSSSPTGTTLSTSRSSFTRFDNTFDGTWSLTGSTLTLYFGNTPVQFSYAAGGGILVATSFNNADGSNILLILVRQN